MSTMKSIYYGLMLYSIGVVLDNSVASPVGDSAKSSSDEQPTPPGGATGAALDQRVPRRRLGTGPDHHHDDSVSRARLPIRNGIIEAGQSVLKKTYDSKHVRQKREYEDYYDYEWNYEGTYDYDKEEKEKEKTLLEKLNTKMTKKFIIMMVVCSNIALCCGCCCLLFCWKFCKECCIATRRQCYSTYDAICCRDNNYRLVQEAMRRIDLEPPSYSQFQMMRESCGIPPGK